MNELYEKVKTIISPVYMVGGSVRDYLLGVEPKDYDFSTPHEPETIERKIREAQRKPFLTGKRFGTIGVKIGGHLVEITTFRTERYQRGNRKPEVEFVDDIVADLSRRDFTINAIAMRDGRIIDPFSGSRDIKEKKIRCVGNATSRFKEDPLRMLRAARFAAQLGFVVEDNVLKTITKLNHRILEVSKERWVGELDRLLLAPFAEKGLRCLMDTGLLNYIIPELSLQREYDQRSRYHSYDLWEHTIRVTSQVSTDIDLRWAALLHDMAKPFVRCDKEDRSTYAKHDILGYEMVMRLGRYLKWSNRRLKAVGELVRDHLKDESPLRESDNNSK
ncbi:MAG: HDIG domain-containing protein [Thermodesulfobacteriota bacterium]|nr:HDIG domain-containing protein [Thermodesulfobacteriota bacterium]